MLHLLLLPPRTAMSFSSTPCRMAQGSLWHVSNCFKEWVCVFLNPSGRCLHCVRIWLLWSHVYNLCIFVSSCPLLVLLIFFVACPGFWDPEVRLGCVGGALSWTRTPSMTPPWELYLSRLPDARVVGNCMLYSVPGGINDSTL